jgi:hypothetical protein
MARTKKVSRQLPRLFVPYKSHHLELSDDGQNHWVTVVIEVEVLTINLNTGNMRVRSIEKFSWDEDEKPQTHAFDLSSDAFFAAFDLVPKT